MIKKTFYTKILDNEKCIDIDALSKNYLNFACLFECPICNNFIYNPIACSMCEGLFGEKCLDEWLKKNTDKSCPTCRNSPFVPKKMNRMLKQQLESCNFNCKYAPKCSKQITYLDYFRHSNECHNILYKCSGVGCNFTGEISQVQIHVSTKCEKTFRECLFCLKDIPSNHIGHHSCHKSENHIHSRNPEECFCKKLPLVRCPFCNELIAKDLEAEHFEICNLILKSIETEPRELVKFERFEKFFIGHEGVITSICISEDNKYLFSACNVASVFKWDIDTSIPIMSYAGHKSSVNRLLLTNKDKILVTASTDLTIKLWDSSTGALLKSFENGHSKIIECIVMHPNGLSIFSGSFDKIALCWKLDGSIAKKFIGHKDFICCMTVSSNGDILYTGSSDNSIISWDIKNSSQIKTFIEHKRGVICMLLIQNDKILITGSDDTTVIAWDAINAIPVKKIVNKHSFPGAILSMAIDENNMILFTGSVDQTIIAWNFIDNTKYQILHNSHDGYTATLLYKNGCLASAGNAGRVCMRRITAIK